MTTGADDVVPVVDAFLKIPAADGRVLSARLWRPEGAGRWPVILEFSPYRVWDLFRGLGEATFPYWAARGYAVVTVDIAGSGASTGLLHDEYLPSELDDACAVIEWCAAQAWCDGNAGLSGLSWAAFTALRVSDRKPAALKAMVLGAVSEDGWLTDVHYLGGLPYTAQVDWAGVMLMFNALPPDPQQFGDGWREEWLKRLNANAPWLIPWLTHAGHDAYWKDKAARFESHVPLLLYCGSADKYATSVLRIAERWKGPVRTIVGPWDHALPNLSPREPRIGYLQEALRWWDRWLKGRETGVMDEAPLRLWAGAPDKDGNTAEGHWRALDWPCSGIVFRELRASAAGPEQIEISSPLATLPADLYEDVPAPYASSGIFWTFPPQQEDIDIVGIPTLHCRLGASAYERPLVARLLDEAPTGERIRMTIGAQAVGSGDDTEITIVLQACGWRLKAGHRLILVLYPEGGQTFSFPVAPHTALNDIRLSLPTLPATDRDETTFAPPVTAAAARATDKLKWIERTREAIVFPPRDHAPAREATTAAHHLTATSTDYFITSRFEIDHGWAAKSYRVAFERQGFSIRVDTRLEMSATADAFHISWQVRASEDGRIVRDLGGDRDVPRVSI